MKPTSPLDITYCMNQVYPFKKCEIHPAALKRLQKNHPGQLVSVADYSGTCRDYVGWIVAKVKSGGNGERNG